MSPILGGRGAGVRAYGFGGAAKPNAPTSVVATDVGTSRAYNNGAASVAFSSGGDNGLPITSYTVTSSPGSFTATGSSSPLTVTGLQSSVQYTYTVTATNAIGTSSASSASAGVTATTVPQAPTIGTATGGNASATVAYTANATGGKTVSTYTATSSGAQTGTGSSPITVSGLTNGTAYTFTVTATNANGTSTASSASNSVTPAYAVGDTGPGGGYVFYDAGSTLSWGRYLEAAKSTASPSWTDAQYQWSGNTSSSVSTSDAIGSGMANTLAMVAQSSTANRAGTVCRAYTGGGYSSSTTGWFLPSMNELDALWPNRVAAGMRTGVGTDSYYWTSSQSAYWANEALMIYFNNRGQSYLTKTSTFYVRPIRAF